MIGNILLVITILITPFLEPLAITLLSFSPFLVLWQVVFKNNDSFISKISLVFISIILDVGFKYYLGSHLLALLLFELTYALSIRVFREDNRVFYVLNKIISNLTYYLCLNLLLVLKFAVLNLSNILYAILSAIVTYLITELIRGKITFKRSDFKI